MGSGHYWEVSGCRSLSFSAKSIYPVVITMMSTKQRQDGSKQPLVFADKYLIYAHCLGIQTPIIIHNNKYPRSSAHNEWQHISPSNRPSTQQERDQKSREGNDLTSRLGTRHALQASCLALWWVVRVGAFCSWEPFPANALISAYRSAPLGDSAKTPQNTSQSGRPESGPVPVAARLPAI